MTDDSKEPTPPPLFTKIWHSTAYPFISPSRPELSARGKHIVVTGGGTGIGKAIAIAFAQAGAASITILGRRADRLLASASDIAAAASDVSGTKSGANLNGNLGTVKVQTFTVDLLQRSEVEAALDTAVARAGPIDVFVSNAGVQPDPVPFDKLNAATLQSAFELNVLTAFHAIQAFLARRSANQPVLVSVSTAAAHVQPWPTFNAYAIAKASNQKLVDCVAAEFPGVHVVSFHPGLVRTELNHIEAIPSPDSVNLPGQFAVWLASLEARFLRGKLVWANFDAEELVQRAEEIQSSKLLNWVVGGILV